MSNIVTYEKPTLPVVGAQTKSAQAMIVVDQDTYDYAVEHALSLKTEREAWEEKRKAYKAPVDLLAKMIQADFMPTITDYDNAITAIRGKTNRYLTDQRAAQIKAQAEADRIAREAAAAAEKAAKAAEKKAPEVAAAIRENAALMSAPVIAPTVVNNTGSSGTVKWKGKVEDKADFLRFIANNNAFIELVEIKQGALDRMINASKGALKFDGVVNYEDVNTTFRA